MFHKIKLIVGSLVIFSFFVAVAPLQAFDRDDERCERRIHKAQEALEKAVRRHGEHSRQAEEKRHELEETRERCHHDRDRDHDHDRDHDRDRH